jgi:hypothetical protein
MVQFYFKILDFYVATPTEREREREREREKRFCRRKKDPLPLLASIRVTRFGQFSPNVYNEQLL